MGVEDGNHLDRNPGRRNKGRWNKDFGFKVARSFTSFRMTTVEVSNVKAPRSIEIQNPK
jgi:hypothetical protein